MPAAGGKPQLAPEQVVQLDDTFFKITTHSCVPSVV